MCPGKNCQFYYWRHFSPFAFFFSFDQRNLRKPWRVHTTPCVAAIFHFSHKALLSLGALFKEHWRVIRTMLKSSLVARLSLPIAKFCQLISKIESYLKGFISGVFRGRSKNQKILINELEVCCTFIKVLTYMDKSSKTMEESSWERSVTREFN